MKKNVIFLTKLNELVTKANEALSADSEITAVSVWSGNFLTFVSCASYRQSKINNKAIVAVQFEPIVHVTATPVSNIHRQYQGINAMGPIPRDCNLKFQLTNAQDLPANAKSTVGG